MRATCTGDAGNDPYSILGVAPEADDNAVRAAYRRLVREHHPDRLIAQGLPEEAVASATDKLALINGAWDRIKQIRNLVWVHGISECQGGPAGGRAAWRAARLRRPAAVGGRRPAAGEGRPAVPGRAHLRKR